MQDQEEIEVEEKAGFNRKAGIIALIVLVTTGIAVASYFLFFRDRGVPGSQLMTQYEKLYDKKHPQNLKNRAIRHRFVVEQVAQGNVPSHFGSFETIQVKGRQGTEVEFEISRTGLRLGNNKDWVEIPVDGPHAAAAAEIYCDCTLPTYWMIQQADKKAMDINAAGIAQKGKGKVRFFASPDIARALKIPWNPNRPDGEKAMSPLFIKKRTELLRKWLAENKISDDQLIAGYTKDIVQPVDNLTCAFGKCGACTGSGGRIEIYGGYDEFGRLIQRISGGFHEASFFDYPQIPRFTRKTLLVNGKRVPMNEFFSSTKFAKEFGFQRSKIHEPPYPYSNELKKFVEKHR